MPKSSSCRLTMRSYRKLQMAIFFSVIFCLLLMASRVSLLNLDHDKIWPFHPARFFSKVPRVINDYGIQILAIDSQSFPNGKDFLSLKKIYAHAHTMRPYYLIQNLGEAYRRGNTSRFNSLRKVFEETYLPALATAEYRIVKREWDVRRAWIEKESYQRKISRVVFEGEYKRVDTTN